MILTCSIQIESHRLVLPWHNHLDVEPGPLITGLSFRSGVLPKNEYAINKVACILPTPFTSEHRSLGEAELHLGDRLDVQPDAVEDRPSYIRPVTFQPCDEERAPDTDAEGKVGNTIGDF
ncbi:MAG: hypothetical protein ACD_75C00536G0001 [uncultured bacterium]|nr:MAG: hypothetical protein ACD_75C00536G0001 [uncultured bacterium]